jgi:DNA-binding NarL/FixJ family response regulator
MRILLVDDQRLFVESLRVYMTTRAQDLEVVGVAYSGEEALSSAKQLQPDLVVMDVRMPGMDGVETSRRFSELLPNIRVLMLTTFDDDSYVFEALKNGAVGYLLKDLDPNELIKAMRAAISGSIQMAPKIASRLVLNAFHRDENTALTTSMMNCSNNEQLHWTPDKNKDNRWFSLSRREREILPLIGQGLDNQEISEELNIAHQTVKNNISNIYDKFEVHSRVHLIRICRSAGWL